MALQDNIFSCPRFSDILIFSGFWRWSGWNTLRDAIFNRHLRMGIFIYAFFIRSMAILTEAFAYPLRCIFRYKSGKLGGAGWIMMVFSAWMIALFNTESSFSGYWSYISKSLDFIYTLIFTWDYEQFASDEFINALWQPQSTALTIFLCCFLIAAVIHIVARMFGYRNSNSWSKGESIIFSLTHKYVRLSRAFCEILLEGALVVGAGLLVDHFLDDYRCALYLWISAFCLFAQELSDHLARVPYSK